MEKRDSESAANTAVPPVRCWERLSSPMKLHVQRGLLGHWGEQICYSSCLCARKQCRLSDPCRERGCAKRVTAVPLRDVVESQWHKL